MASAKELKIIQQSKQDWDKYEEMRQAAIKKGDTSAAQKALKLRDAEHKKADQARGFSTTTKVNQQGKYYQSVKSAQPPVVSKITPQITTAARVRTGTLPQPQKTQDVNFTLPMGNTIQVKANVPKKNILEEAFDPKENYIEKFKQGNVGGAAANFVGTGLTAGQTFLTNSLNNIQSLAQGKGVQEFKPQMSARDLENEIYKRSGDRPISQILSEKNPLLGSAYGLGLEIATDPLELTPIGMANDIKLAKGLNQNSQAYLKALQSGKLNSNGITATLPKANTPAPQPRIVPKAVVSKNAAAETIAKAQTPISSAKSQKSVADLIVDYKAQTGKGSVDKYKFAEFIGKDIATAEKMLDNALYNSGLINKSNYGSYSLSKKGREVYKAQPEIRPQAPNLTARPRNPEKGITAPKEQMFAQNASLPKSGKVENKLKALGADTNRFEEVAMVTTDSEKLKPSLLERAAGITSNVKRKFVDSGDTVAKIAKINNDQGLYNLYNNAKNARRRAEYHIGEAQTDINGKAVGKSLKDIFDPIRKKGDNYYEDFQEYMYHLHNIDRMGFEGKALSKLRQFEIEHQELADLTDAQLKEMLKTTDNDSAAIIKEYINLIDEVNNAPSKPVFGKSITSDESKKVSAYLLQQHPEFAQEAGEVRKYLDNMLQYRVQGGLVSEDSAKALSEMYQNYVPTYRVNPSTKGVRYSGQITDIKTGIKKATGSSKDLLPLHEQISKQTMQAVDAAHKNLFGIRLAENINPNTQQFVQELKKVDDAFDIDADAVPELKNTFNVYENGQAYQMKVDDGLYEGIKALAGTDPNELTKIALAANKGFKELITSWNPMFLVRNVVRDIQDVGLYSKNLAKFAKMYPAAAKELATNGEVWKQYKALGGAGNSFFDYAKGYKDDPSWIRKNTLDRVEQLNMATEQLPRLAEFMATLENLGHAPNYDELMQAMYNAADVTVNFGRSGTWGKTLNSTFVPFFNPAMQGTSKLIRRFTETKGVKDWTALVLKVSALGVAPSLINEIVYHDDPQYQIINDREKDINFLFKIGDGEWVKIPKGRVLSLFGSGAQRLYRASQGDEDAFAGYIQTMGDQVAPISPTESNIYSPIAAVKNNKSWFGGRIEPQRLEKYSPGLRFDESTTAPAKWLGAKINKSPKKIDYLADAYTGIIGDVAMPLLTPRAERNPVAKAFTIDSVSNNKLSQQFFDKMDELKYAKNDKEGSDQYDVLNKYMNRQSDAISDLNDKIRTIENGLGTDAFKREKVREVKAQINKLEQDSLAVLPKIEKATKEATANYKEVDNRNSEKYKDLTDEQYKEKKAQEKVDAIYRESNRKVFGAEYALKTYDKDVYEKALSLKPFVVSLDQYYDSYFAQKDIEGVLDPTGEKFIPLSKSFNKKQAIDKANPGASPKELMALYHAFGISEKLW